MNGELDFSAVALFLRATWPVKVVIIMLLAISIISWAVAINKVLQFRVIKSQFKRFSEVFWSGQTLEAIHQNTGDGGKSAVKQIFSAGMTEWSRSRVESGKIMPGTADRIGRATDVALQAGRLRWEAGLSTLATIGSTAPFIGLFGTVWGIKSSFESIAASQSTNIVVVAPGIAEALFATALGLLAAIPAVVFYNKLSRDVDALYLEHEKFSDQFNVILARQIERGAA